ncbi:MAG: histidine kinase [Acidobacteria bacterium]|nr:MAG: histidine kinase [Acidobacteriota bacterium]PIE91065.1 MAG: histidine kinase [Acidobacteriota bacterium]
MNRKLSDLIDEMIHHEIGIKLALREVEAMYIQKVLSYHQGNITLAADQLNMHRNTLTRKIQNLEIDKMKGRSG